MNERIKELESQAWEQVNRTNGLVRTEDFNQKFAELIVRECASIAFDAYAATDGADSGESAILKHFGVE